MIKLFLKDKHYNNELTEDFGNYDVCEYLVLSFKISIFLLVFKIIVNNAKIVIKGQ